MVNSCALARDDDVLPTNEVTHHLAFLQADEADNHSNYFHLFTVVMPTNEVTHHLAFLQADEADNHSNYFHLFTVVMNIKQFHLLF